MISEDDDENLGFIGEEEELDERAEELKRALDDVIEEIEELEGNTNRSGIRAGVRTEQWFTRLERKVDENSTEIDQNNKKLTELDIRTLWISRIAVGILIAVVSQIILVYFGIL